MLSKTAIFYICSADYQHEAIRSAVSVWNAHPDNQCDVFFFTSGPFVDDRFDVFVFARESQYWYVDATRMMLIAAIYLRDNGYERALYLDTDTYCCGSIDNLVRILERHDFAAAHAPGRVTRKGYVVDVPSSFPEFNIGVNPLRLTLDTIGMLSDWYNYYKENADIWGNNDQPSLREILWLNDRKIRIATLPPEFNFRFGFGGFLRGQCVFLHGRDPDLGRVATEVNRRNDFRTFRRGELG